MSADMRAILRDIESRDPDGGTVEPTDAAYAAHEQWAIATYGREAWATYRVGGWEERSEI